MRHGTARLRRKTLLYRLTCLVFRTFAACFGGFRCSGAEYIPRRGPAVVMANHESFMDPPLIGSMLRRPVCFLAKAELFRSPLRAWYFRQLLTTPIHRGSADLAAFRACARLLEEGNLVGLFPEGSRSLDGKLRPAQPGAIAIALKAGVPIIPIGIVGTFEVLPPGGRLTPAPIAIAAGPPLYYPHLAGRADKQALRHVGDEVMRAIAHLCARLEREQAERRPNEVRGAAARPKELGPWVKANASENWPPAGGAVRSA